MNYHRIPMIQTPLVSVKSDFDPSQFANKK